MKLRHRLFYVLIAAVACDGLEDGCGPRCVQSADGVWRFYIADIMMADSTPVTRSGDAWVSSGTAVAANMIQPMESVTDTFAETSENCVLFEGVTSWDSDEGPPSVTLASSRQTADARYDGSRYVISGLQATAAFGETDTFEVSADDTDTTVEVEAPPAIGDVDDHLGDPDGLATVFRAPSGEYDAIIVFVAAAASGEGQSGIMCGYRPDQTGGDGSWDETPLVDADTIAAFEARGLVAESVSVAFHNEEVSNDLFADPIAVHAGRMFSIQASDLDP